MNLYDTKERMMKMLHFKVLVIQRGKAFIALPYDVKKNVVILGSAKSEVLKKSQLAVIDEVKERRELFIPGKVTTKEEIIEKKKFRLESGDNVTLEEVGIEFSDNSVRLEKIQ